MKIYRYNIIQEFIDVLSKTKKINYLEIGVRDGDCFLKIKADKKLAIDPNFVISKSKKVKTLFRNSSNFRNKYFEATSDDFFEKKSEMLAEIGGVDVVFIDGLHQYEQVMRDVQNSLKILNKNGVILMHDCNPTFAAAAVRGSSPQEIAENPPEGWTGEWNGDVWKCIVNLRSMRDDLEILVYDCDYGIGQVRKGKPDSMLTFSLEEIDKMDYSDLEKNRQYLLNLKAGDEYINYIKANL